VAVVAGVAVVVVTVVDVVLVARASSTGFVVLAGGALAGVGAVQLATMVAALRKAQASTSVLLDGAINTSP